MPRELRGSFEIEDRALWRNHALALIGIVFLALALTSGCAVGPHFKQPPAAHGRQVYAAAAARQN